MQALADAEAALAADNPVAALDALLVLWRETRSPDLAKVIDALTNLLSRSLAPVVGKTRAKFQEQWVDLANARRACDVGRLMAAFNRQPWSQLRERVERLAQWPEDPRIAFGLAQFIQELPTTTSVPDTTWNLIFRIIARVGDVRCAGPLEVRQAMPSRGGLFFEALPPKLTKALTALAAVKPIEVDARTLNGLRLEIARLELLPPITEAQVLASVVVPADAPNEEELLRRIYETPEDDGARLVYADFLAERGDPRGEFIALQFKPSLTGVQKKRVRALLREHGRAWLGEIEPAVQLKSEVFERGFVSACRFDFRTASQRETLIVHPAWSTVTRLAVWESAPGASTDFLLRNELRGLRELELVISAELAGKMAERPAPYRQLRALKVGLENAQKPQLRALATAAAFPLLDDLTVRGLGGRDQPNHPFETFTWLFESPLGRRLVRVGVEQIQLDLREWLPRLKALPSLKELDLGMWPPISFVRDGDGWAARIRSAWQGDKVVLHFAPTLKETVHRVELGPPHKWDGAARDALKLALAGVEIVEATA